MDSRKRISPYFILINGVAILLYFDIVNHYWFVKLLGGYLIRIWVPPFLLFLFVLIQMMVKGANIFSMRPINVPLFFYALFGLAAMLFNESLFGAIKYYLIMIAPVWFYAVLTDGLKDNMDVARMMKVLFFCGFLFCIQTAYYRIQSAETPIPEQDIVISAGNVIGFGGVTPAKVKKGESFVEHSRGILNVEHGNYCGMLTPLVLFGLMSFVCSRGRTRFFYLVVSFLMLAQIIDTMSRVGMVTVAVGIFILGWYIFQYKKRERLKIIITLSFIITAAIAYLIAFDKMAAVIRFLDLVPMFELPSFLREYKGLLPHVDVVDPHIATMGESFKTFLASPLFGSGFVFKGEGTQELNRYLFILASAGIFTFISYILFFWGLIVSIRKTMLNFRPLKSYELNYGYLFFAFGIAFLLKFSNQGQELFYYWIIFAIASAWVRNTKNERLIVADYNVKA